MIGGYRQCTRELPNYEQREPDIELYAKLEKRSAKRTLIGERGSVFRQQKLNEYSDRLLHRSLYPIPSG